MAYFYGNSPKKDNSKDSLHDYPDTIIARLCNIITRVWVTVLLIASDYL